MIGAGIGGLSAALALAAAGEPVTVLEAQGATGGKLRTVASPAGPVDAGPTVFTFRAVFDELFDAAGTALEAELALTKADVIARHAWATGPRLDLYADPRASEAAIEAFAGSDNAAGFASFSARAKLLFEAFEGPVMRAAKPSALGVAAQLGRDAARLVPAMGLGHTLWSGLCRQFTDTRLRQLFARYATYVGGSPFLSPALLMLIWHSEARGVFLVEGGMAALAQTLTRLIEARGGRVLTGHPVARIEVEGGRATAAIARSGERFAARAILFNGDPAALSSGLLGPDVARAVPALPPRRRSLSAWVWTFAGRAGAAPLAHHTVVFGGDYRREFHELFAQSRIPSDPTLYVCAQDRAADGSGAPELERFQIIMNAPATGDGRIPKDKEFTTCERTVFEKLSQAGLTIAPATLEGALTTPWDFARMFPGAGGAIYGANPHGMLSTFQRPTARTALKGLYLAGGGAHPGPGVPMAALSGRLAAAAMLADRASTSRSRPMAMPGGMSMGYRTTARARSPSSPS